MSENVVDRQNDAVTRLELVRRVVRQWSAELTDLGARNNLLVFRNLKRGTLSLKETETKAQSSLLQNRTVRLSALFPDPEARADALQRARVIYAKSKENFEERGLETLHLACGLAKWENSRGAWIPSAPVLLRPARLKPLGAGLDDFELSLEGDMELNQSLVQVLKFDFSLNIDQNELLDLIDGVIDEHWELQAAYDWLDGVSNRVPGFGIDTALALGNFAYAKLPMVRDLEGSIEQLAEHDLIAAVAGDEQARASIQRTIPDDNTVPRPDQIPPRDEFLVLDADSSQSFAINAAIAGENLIIKGPPGTGKSQTIANLIASLISRGKTVLFVAEKRAAIDAVLKRLSHEHLSDLVLDLHGGATSRRSFANAIGETLNALRFVEKVDPTSEHRRLVRRRNELNTYAASLHETREPWNVTPYEIHERLLRVEPDADLDVRFRDDTLDRLDDESFESVCEDLAAYVRLGGFTLTPEREPWASANISTPQEAADAWNLVDHLRRTAFPELLRRLTDASERTALRPCNSMTDWEDRLELLEDCAETLTVFTPQIFDLDLRLAVIELEPASRKGIGPLLAMLTSSVYRRARRTVSACANSPVGTNRDLLASVIAAAEVSARWPGVREGCSGLPNDLTEIGELFERVRENLEELGQTLVLDGVVAGAGVVEGITSLLGRLTADRSTLIKLPELARLKSRLLTAGLAELLDALCERGTDAPASLRALECAWLRSILDRLMFTDARYGGFDGTSHEHVVEEYSLADREHTQSTASRILRICAERATAARENHPDQARLLLHQSNLKKRHMPVRDIVAQAPDVLLALKPCWAMSPLVVSQILPPRTMFDVTIFDEASQVTPADAVTSIFRARQVVVAGDEHQLPPTAFFLSGTDEEEDEDELPLVPTSVPVGTVGFESILDALNSQLRFRMLEWHYRSRDERLIAFSNAHIYGRMLTTFPSSSHAPCLSHVHVQGPGGETNSPSAEVDAVVELVLDHARTRPNESLGVIAMGTKHAHRVEEALRQRLREDPSFNDFFDEAREEPFFVKNLERVQGDERDAIILSVGYGKNDRDQLAYRFGPLNLEGGHRRLNVAITRAKNRGILVSSFSSHDMDPERLKSEGMKLLRQYLQYCESGASNLGDRTLVRPPMNAFELDVQQTLQRKGLRLTPQYGTSGYWIDFVVQHPKQPGRLVLAIECDGAMYHSSPSARDRDRLRQEQLERLGWTFHRIWSTEWFHKKDDAVAKVLAAYNRALAKTVDERPPVAPSKPAPRQSANGKSRGARPRCPPGWSIDEYSSEQLIEMAAWIESDEVLRTHDDLLAELIQELGFQRRGTKIVLRLSDAISRARARKRRG